MDTRQDTIFGDSSESQISFGIDDGSGLRVVSAKFNSEKKFDWDIFDGFDSLRVLTYSVSVDAILRMLDKYAFTTFECVFGYEGIIRDMKDILAFQKTVVGEYSRRNHGPQRRTAHTNSRESTCRTSPLQSLEKVHSPRKALPAIQFGWPKTSNNRIRQPLGTGIFRRPTRDTGHVR